MGRILIVLFAVTLGVVGVFGYRWYQYATAGEPYDEVGVALNSYAPPPLRQWACDQVRRRHPTGLPPFGCQAR